jgi:hypothetical protein
LYKKPQLIKIDLVGENTFRGSCKTNHGQPHTDGSSCNGIGSDCKSTNSHHPR